MLSIRAKSFNGLSCSFFLIFASLFIVLGLLFPGVSFSQVTNTTSNTTVNTNTTQTSTIVNATEGTATSTATLSSASELTNNTNNNSELQTFRSETLDSFNVPYQLANNDRRQPAEYVFEEPTSENWILTIDNDLQYANTPESKTVIKIKEPLPSEKFVELILFGDESKKFIVSVNTNETGYVKMYENSPNGWSTDNPITVSHANIQGLSVNNGQRIVLDKLGMDGFNVGSVQVYGKDEPQLPDSNTGGSIQFELLSGDYSQSVLYYLPLIMLVIVGGVVILLLKLKKRN